MDGKPRVAPVARHRLSRVQAHPHLDLDAFGPGVRQQGELALDGRQQSFAGTREGNEEGVPLRVHLIAAMGCERRTKQALMVPQHGAVAVAELLDEPGRPSMSVKRNVTAPVGISAMAWEA
jgi:hypothetical protein